MADLPPVKFGFFELDPFSGELRRRGLRVRLTPQASVLLCMLLEPPLRTRTRDEIQRRLWPANTYVDFERSMNKVVHSLREALGETARNPRFIETVPSGGYRFFSEFLEHPAGVGYFSSPDRVERIAVLPIVPGSSRPELAALAQSVASTLIEKLAIIPGLRVMAESTVRSHNVDGLDPGETGRTLGVRAVLSGEFFHQGRNLFLRMELIDSDDGALLCAAHAAHSARPANGAAEHLAQQIIDCLRPLLSAWQLQNRNVA